MTEDKNTSFLEWVGAFTMTLVVVSVLGFFFGAGAELYFRIFGQLPVCDSGNIIWGEAEDYPSYYLLVCEK